ncbi:DUF6705 family protein [Bizionia sp.]|uniref:DUF6705 family protein n=1 Tax=Bizionia sp. TaxID=1954480 RepID=UPI003A8CFDC4
MKILNILILFLLIGTSCKAQSPIINIEDDDGSAIVNAYYKDTNNLLDPFVGTWIFDDGAQYLKIVFEKRTMIYNGKYYEDLLIGEFQYKENNVELTNTLNNLLNSLPHIYQYNINGNYIQTNSSPFESYTSDNFRVGLTMSEPNGCASNLDVRTGVVNGQEAIQIFKRGGMVTLRPSDPVPPEPIIPGGFYYLIKE